MTDAIHLNFNVFLSETSWLCGSIFTHANFATKELSHKENQKCVTSVYKNTAFFFIHHLPNGFKYLAFAFAKCFKVTRFVHGHAH